ncbi:MAG TPA: hypothetical protein VFF76_00310, partial [Holophagaceae bacterium]|nr:hypothetical protein [Holophagaceae bacterium]
ALAGSAYAFVMAARQQNHLGAQPAWWPWVNGWEPSTNHEDISKALGYLVAELERLHRAEGKGSKPLVLVPG